MEKGQYLEDIEPEKLDFYTPKKEEFLTLHYGQKM